MLENWTQERLLSENPRLIVRLLVHCYNEVGERLTGVLRVALNGEARHGELIRRLRRGDVPAEDELRRASDESEMRVAALRTLQQFARETRAGFHRLEQQTRHWEEV